MLKEIVAIQGLGSIVQGHFGRFSLSADPSFNGDLLNRYGNNVCSRIESFSTDWKTSVCALNGVSGLLLIDTQRQ
jgi:hypothetical protein